MVRLLSLTRGGAGAQWPQEDHQQPAHRHRAGGSLPPAHRPGAPATATNPGQGLPVSGAHQRMGLLLKEKQR